MINKLFSLLDNPLWFLYFILGLSVSIVLAAAVKSMGLAATIEMLLRFAAVLVKALAMLIFGGAR